MVEEWEKVRRAKMGDGNRGTMNGAKWDERKGL